DLSFHLGLLGDQHELESVTPLFIQHRLDEVDPGSSVYDVEEHAAVVLHLSGGLRYYWERGNNGHVEVPNETRIYGTKAGIKLQFCSWESPVIEFFDVAEGGQGQARSEAFHVDMSQHSDEAAFAQHLISLWDGQTQAAMPLERAAKHLDIVFKAYEALARL
ncbi:MAG: hypothetical protein HC842_08770, partial [Cytophagales bacterium]|nr:hypothetical protein [Cytophagales bacterium]